MPRGQGRSNNQKLKMLYLYQYLLYNTDEDTSVTPKDIIAYMKTKDIDVERKTVYKDVQLLSDTKLLDLGATDREEDDVDDLTDEELIALDSKKYVRKNPIIYNRKEGEKGYRVYHYYDSQEILNQFKIVVDIIQASKFITQEQANTLTDFIVGYANKNKHEQLRRRCYIFDRVRSENKDVIKALDEIYRAIDTDRKISFRYVKYIRPEKKKESRHTSKPVAVLCYDGYYYCLTTNIQYRIDRMYNVKCLDDVPRGDMGEYENFNEQSAQDVYNRRFSAFDGNQEEVTLQFANELTDTIADRYGMDRLTALDDYKHFTITETIEVNQQFYGWLCGFGENVKIISPSKVRDMYKRYLRKITEMYQDEEDAEKSSKSAKSV